MRFVTTVKVVALVAAATMGTVYEASAAALQWPIRCYWFPCSIHQVNELICVWDGFSSGSVKQQVITSDLQFESLGEPAIQREIERQLPSGTVLRHSLHPEVEVVAGNPPQQNLANCRAGTAPFQVGQAGITVTFPVPMPSPYSVVVQPTNTAGYSPVPACTYFNVLKKTPHQFQVQHKRCDDGVPVNLDTNVSLDWIVCSQK